MPAGGALAVDRDRFAQAVTEAIEDHPRIGLRREEVKAIPGAVHHRQRAVDGRRSGERHCAVGRTAAPVLLRRHRAHRRSRLDRHDDRVSASRVTSAALINRRRRLPQLPVHTRRVRHLHRRRSSRRSGSSCATSNGKTRSSSRAACRSRVLAKRGHDALAFGPMKPIGLRDPRTGKRPHAVVQLRQDNLAGNAVQHRRLSDQPEVAGAKARVSLDPGPGERGVSALRHDASQHVHQFAALLHPTMQFRTRADLFFAGQITGVEGYIGNMRPAGWWRG